MSLKRVRASETENTEKVIVETKTVLTRIESACLDDKIFINNN